MKSNRHHPAIRILHWLVAFLIIAALVMSTFVMSRIPDSDPEKLAGLIRHMSVGGIVLVLTLARRFIRSKTPRPEPLHSGMAWADRIAPIAHQLLDVLILVMIGSGAGMALMAGVPAIVWNGGGFPVNLDSFFLHAVHVSVASLLVGVLFLHIGGALFHQFILRDGLVSRMLFGPGVFNRLVGKMRRTLVRRPERSV